MSLCKPEERRTGKRKDEEEKWDQEDCYKMDLVEKTAKGRDETTQRPSRV
jgi:hypothetical protein